MIYNFIPAAIMFVVTVVFVTAFFVPITTFRRKDKLLNFYWVGAWSFLVIITSIAGAQSTLMILEYNTLTISNALLSGVTTSFICFIVFAWFRLSSTLIFGFTRRLVKVQKD